VGLVWNVQHPRQADTRKPRTAYVDLANSKDRYTYWMIMRVSLSVRMLAIDRCIISFIAEFSRSC
jgi:hypothetical protein